MCTAQLNLGSNCLQEKEFKHEQEENCARVQLQIEVFTQ